MALTIKSIDEILTLMSDVYDSLITPFRIFRNNNNKLWLVFRAIAAGYAIIQDSALALHNKFDPAMCADEDLLSTAKMVGTEMKTGAGSLLVITAKNNNASTAKTLLAGDYKYTSVNGDIFLFTLTIDASIDPLGTLAITARSQDKGAFAVSANTTIVVNRVDNTSIDAAITFSCADNASSLGYPDETTYDFRQRILTDTNRQDAIAELELDIRNLPSILECNIMFNQNATSEVVDGITLDPYQMLIIIAGAPEADMAELIVSRVIYHTKMVDPLKVLYHLSTLYVGGHYPIYYTNYATKDFSLNIEYRYDSTKTKPFVVEAAMQVALNYYRNMSQHISTLTESDVYNLLAALNLLSVRVVNIDLLVAALQVPYIDVISTRMLNLTDVTFTSFDVGA